MVPARATLVDLANLAPGWSRISTISTARQQAALNAASDWLDGQLRNQYTLPLVAPYPQDVIDFEVVRASFRMILNVGFDPLSPADKAIADEYLRQMDWARAVGSGTQGINGLDSTVGPDGPDGPHVITATSRGYSERGLTPGRVPVVRTGAFSDD